MERDAELNQGELARNRIERKRIRCACIRTFIDRINKRPESSNSEPEKPVKSQSIRKEATRVTWFCGLYESKIGFLNKN